MNPEQSAPVLVTGSTFVACPRCGHPEANMGSVDGFPSIRCPKCGTYPYMRKAPEYAHTNARGVKHSGRKEDCRWCK